MLAGINPCNFVVEGDLSVVERLKWTSLASFHLLRFPAEIGMSGSKCL